LASPAQKLDKVRELKQKEFSKRKIYLDPKDLELTLKNQTVREHIRSNSEVKGILP
jgi:hypothetical protein